MRLLLKETRTKASSCHRGLTLAIRPPLGIREFGRSDWRSHQSHVLRHGAKGAVEERTPGGTVTHLSPSLEVGPSTPSAWVRRSCSKLLMMMTCVLGSSASTSAGGRRRSEADGGGRRRSEEVGGGRGPPRSDSSFTGPSLACLANASFLRS